MTQRPFFGGGEKTGETPEEKQARIFRAFKPRTRRLPGFDEPIPTDFLTESQRKAISQQESGVDFMPGYENVPADVMPSLFDKNVIQERQEIPGFGRYTMEAPGQYAGKDRPLTSGELSLYDIRGELFDPITGQAQVPIPYEYIPRKPLNTLAAMGGTWLSAFEEGARWIRGDYEKSLRFVTGDEEAKYTEALRKHEAAIGRELDMFEEQKFFDETFTDIKWLPDRWTRGTTELAIEIFVPANLIEKTGEKLITKAVVPLYKHGIKPVWKGGTQYLPGIGEIVEFVTPDVVQRMFARRPDLSKVSTSDLIKYYDSALPLRDSTAWERLVLESPNGTVSPGDIQRSNIDVHISRTVPRGGADFSSLTPAEREALLREVNEASAAADKELNEILAELKKRDIIGEEYITEAETGKDFTAYVFHGSGRSNMEAAYSDWGTRQAILGDGLYGSPFREFAEGFGPNLEVIPINLKNPLVISTDTEWGTLTKRAGLFSHMPAGPDEITALRNVIIESGYDGLVIRVPEDEIIGKRLQQAFSFDTVVKLDDPRLLDETLDIVDVAKVHDLMDVWRATRGGPIPVDNARGISQRLGISESHVTRIMEDLEQKGLVRKTDERTWYDQPEWAASPTKESVAAGERIGEIRKAGMEAIAKAGEVLPDFRLLRELGAGGRFRTIDEVIDYATASNNARISSLQKEADEFNKYANDLKSGNEDLAEPTREWVINHQDDLVDNYGIDSKVFAVTDRGLPGGIADEALLTKELDRLSREAQGDLRSLKTATDEIADRILRQEEDIMRRGQEALRPKVVQTIEELETRIANVQRQLKSEKPDEFAEYYERFKDDPYAGLKIPEGIFDAEMERLAIEEEQLQDALRKLIARQEKEGITGVAGRVAREADEAAVPITRESRTDLPDEYFDADGNLLEERSILDAIAKLRGIASVDKPKGGWGRIITRIQNAINKNEEIYNIELIEQVDEIEGLIDEFKEGIEREGLTAEEFGEAKDEAFELIREHIDDVLEISDGFREVLEEAVEIVPREIEEAVPSRVIDVETTPTRDRVDEIIPNPPETNTAMARAADEAPVNSGPPVSITRTTHMPPAASDLNPGVPPPVTRRSSELPPATGIIEGEGRIIPPGRGKVTGNLGGMFGEEPRMNVFHREWWDDKFLRFMENWNNQFFGLYKLQGLAEKGDEAITAFSKRIGTGIDLAPARDLITILTRVPGASNAAMVRFRIIGNKLKIIAPRTLPEHINQYLAAKRQLEVLAKPGMEGRKIPGAPGTGDTEWENETYKRLKKAFPGYFKEASVPRWTKEMVEKELRDMEYELGPDLWMELEAGAKVILDAYDDMRERLVASGLMSRQLADKFRTEHRFYNPIQYVNKSDEIAAKAEIVGTAKTFNVYDNNIRRLTEEGSPTKLRKPLDLLGDSLLRNEARIMENDAAHAMILLGDAVGIKGLRKYGQDETADPARAVSFFENGRQVTYEVPVWMKRESEYVRRSSSDDVGAWVGRINGISRAAFTTVSPIFIPVNILNDMLTSYVTRGILPHESAARLLKSFTKSQKSISQAHRLAGGYQARFYGEYKAKLPGSIGIYEGEVLGKTGYNRVIRNAFRDTFKTGFGITKVGEAAEQAPRQAFFKREMDRALGKGWESKFTPEEIAKMPVARKAAADSVELTLNFARGGKFVKNLNQYVIFLNAAMEGVKLPFRALKANPNARLRLGAVMGGQAALTEYNLGYPEYQDIPSEERWGSVIVMLPHKFFPPEIDKATGRPLPNYISIVPRTREWALFLSPITYAMERANIEYPSDFASYAQALIGATMPINEIPTPVMLKEAIQQGVNFDMFRDRKIVPVEMQNKPIAEQAMPWTDRTFREIGERFNMTVPGLGWDLGISPIRAEHAFYSTFGGTGRVGTGISDQILEWMDPTLVSPEMTELMAQFEELPLPRDRTKFINELPPEQREDFFYELNRPDIPSGLGAVPVAGPIVSGIGRRLHPGHYGDIRKRIEEKVGRETGIDPQQTREVHAELRAEGEKNHRKQQQLDEQVLTNKISPAKWIEERRLLGMGYRGAFNSAENRFENAAHFADPEKRQYYYGELAKLGGLTDPDILKGRVLVSAYYAIELEEGPKESILDEETGETTVIPDAVVWDKFWTAKNNFLDSLSDEESGILESELKASMTPVERQYFEDSKLMQPFSGIATNIIKYIEGTVELEGMGLSAESQAFLTEKSMDMYKDKGITLEAYSEFDKNQDPYKATEEIDSTGQPTKRAIRNMFFQDLLLEISVIRQIERENNYELEKALFMWEKIDSPLNQRLYEEVEQLKKESGGAIDMRFKLDREMMQNLAPQPEPAGMR